MASEIIGALELNPGQILGQEPVRFNGWPMGSGRSVIYSGEGICEFPRRQDPSRRLQNRPVQ